MEVHPVRAEEVKKNNFREDLFFRLNVVLSPEVANILTNYSWPGNVRELENLVEYLFIVNPMMKLK